MMPVKFSPRDPIGALAGVFLVVAVMIIGAGVGGISLLDIARSYVAAEGIYSKAQKAAVNALYRYRESRDPADFAAYERHVDIPWKIGQARKAIIDDSRPIAESYAYWEAAGIHPEDAPGLSWLARNFDETWWFREPMRIWERGDEKIAELRRAGGELHSLLNSDSPSEEAIQELLVRINTIDMALTEAEADFSEVVGRNARRTEAILRTGIILFGSVLTLLAGLYAVRTRRHIRETDHELRIREERLKDVAEVAADWIWETDADHRYTYLSTLPDTVSGIDKENYLGKRRWDLPADPGPQGWTPLIDKVERRERFENVQYSLIDSAGVRHHLRINGKPLFDMDGVFRGYRGTGKDVTAEVEALQEAKARRDILETAFENLGHGISVFDRDLRIVAYNNRFLELMDLPPDAVSIGDSFEAFIRFNCERGEYGDVDPDELLEQRIKLIRQPEGYHLERTRPDGSVLRIRGNQIPSGGYVTTYSDITAEKTIQNKLIESERQTREVIDRALDAYFSIDEDSIVLDWNPAAESAFGWTRKEAVGTRLTELIIPERYRQAHDDGVSRYLESGETALIGRRVELSAMRKDGREVPIELTVSAQEIGGRQVFNAFARDVSERKMAERVLKESKETAEAANLAKTEFLANMSHELRTPLNAIIGFSEIMSDGLMGPLSDSYAGYARNIHRSGQHLLGLITDILDISQIEAGQLILQPEVCRVHEAAEAARNLLEQRATMNNVQVLNEIPADAPGLYADPRRLRQVLLNLVGNAIKYSQPLTTVHIRLQTTENSIAIQVVDHGIGMQTKEIERAYEPFVQLNTAHGRSHEGTGLGLSIVKRIVELHDGTITLDSEPGSGTVATVSFPDWRVDAPSETAQEASRSTS